MAGSSITLSRRNINAFDRVGGANLILPWPAGLALGKSIAPDNWRSATAAEKAAAEEMVRDACQAAGLVPVRVRVVRPPTPSNVKADPQGPNEWLQRLAVTIIGQRWVHAWGQRDKEPPDVWLQAEYYRTG